MMVELSEAARHEGGIAATCLSRELPARRAELLAAYERDVYGPAFPDPSIREDPSYWLGLLDADAYPPPPQPLIDVAMLLGPDGAPLGGATIEFYRQAGSGLLTYLSVSEARRSQGLGRRLVALARSRLDAMAGSKAWMLAETERLEDAADPRARAETELRQRRLSALGARWVQFDYVMPPLRRDSEPHRLHMMIFDPELRHASLPADGVARLIRELAEALGADLLAHEDTRAMMRFLDTAESLPVVPLPVVARQ